MKLAGSEQDPFTELYIAHTLETVFKWVINVLTGTVALPWPQCLTTKAPTTPPTHDRLTTDQWLPLLYFTYTSMQKNYSRREQCFVQILPQTTELSASSFRSTNISLPVARLSHTVKRSFLKSFLKYNREKGISFKAWFTLDPHVPLLSAGICWSPSVGTIFSYISQASTLSGPRWIRTNTAQQHCSDKLKIFKANLISGKSSICQHRTCNTK